MIKYYNENKILKRHFYRHSAARFSKRSKATRGTTTVQRPVASRLPRIQITNLRSHTARGSPIVFMSLSGFDGTAGAG